MEPLFSLMLNYNFLSIAKLLLYVWQKHDGFNIVILNLDFFNKLQYKLIG